eukprot:COSAG02_NODE_7677_length_2898_cov_5.833869_1_plen_122_part_00
MIHDLAGGPVAPRLRVAAVALHALLTIDRLVVLGREFRIVTREQRALRDGCVCAGPKWPFRPHLEFASFLLIPDRAVRGTGGHFLAGQRTVPVAHPVAKLDTVAHTKLGLAWVVVGGQGVC